MKGRGEGVEGGERRGRNGWGGRGGEGGERGEGSFAQGMEVTIRTLRSAEGVGVLSMCTKTAFSCGHKVRCTGWGGDLMDDGCGLALRVRALLHQPFEQPSACCQVHHKPGLQYVTKTNSFHPLPSLSPSPLYASPPLSCYALASCAPPAPTPMLG